STLADSLRSGSRVVVVGAPACGASRALSSVAVPAGPGSRSAVAPPDARGAFRASLRSTTRAYNRNVTILAGRDLLATRLPDTSQECSPRRRPGGLPRGHALSLSTGSPQRPAR